MTLPFIELKKGQTWTDLPNRADPFYAIATEGIFLCKRTAIGRSILKIDNMPKSLGEMGHKIGYLEWGNTPKIPAEICAQIVSFFRRIWDTHKAEAEVLLTARIEMEEGIPVIKEWRVFIPTQKVSMGAVQSVYEPSHIARGHMVVGTMHSHCNFSAFHSGTDQADAARMDGVHFTIGHVDKEKPQVVSMISASGVHATYEPEDLADFSNLSAGVAPAWWDNYVTPSSDINSTHKPVGFSNFQRYEKPTYTPSSYTPSTPGYHGWNGGWGDDEYHYGSGYSNRALVTVPDTKDDKPKTIKDERIARQEAKGENLTIGDMLKNLHKDDKQWLKDHGFESVEEFIAAADDALLPDDTRSTDRRVYDDEDIKAKKIDDDDFWEEKFDKRLIDIIFDSELLSENDIDDILRNSSTVDNNYMMMLFLDKLKGLGKALKLLGLDLTVDLSYNQNLLKNKSRRERRQIKAEQRRRQTRGGFYN